MALPIRALKQMAIFWGVVSGSGSLIMYCLMQNKLSNTEAYKQSLHHLEEHSEAMAALGTPPLRTHYVSLSDVTQNRLDASNAQLCIPVSGSLSSGMLRTRSARDVHMGWHVEEAALEMNNGHVITILPSTAGSHQS
uniref:Ribosomal protein L37 n=1 Tax=Eptatretus burgeri TaxID=7764 RepID=A0A8C4QJ00_EPTBU